MDLCKLHNLYILEEVIAYSLLFLVLLHGNHHRMDFLYLTLFELSK
jgi:hypothetical protein